MKTMAIILLFAGLSNLYMPQNDNYVEAMTRNIKTVYTSQSLTELQQAVNAFDRIAATEKGKWEPYYYAGFGYIMMANIEKLGEKKDQYLDQAAASVKKAKAIEADNSEVIALEGFVHMIRLTVDPAGRGQQYSGLALEEFRKALSLDPENPRALALLAQVQFGTAQFLGYSTDEACASNAAALKRFANSTSGAPLAPQWGKEMAELLKGNCK